MAMATEAQLRDYLKRTTAELRKAREELSRERARVVEPVAVVSAACRFPGGVRTPEALWELVVSGREVVGDFPADRGWDLEGLLDRPDSEPGTSYCRRGGFLDDAADFDAEFFGISPREALAMAPQQRLVLHLANELIERSPLDNRSGRDDRVGVFVGADDQDYAQLLVDAPPELHGYIGTGTLPAVIAGRVAYVFGFTGPVVTVDTACSSALVAVHLAVQALRTGECNFAIAGGVAVSATPTVFTEFSRQRGLSVDGRCRSFAASADGTGFAEGGGLVLLERLSDAQRLGHPVLAVVRGSAVNSDGASNGLTAPSGPAQQAVIRAALANAGLDPAGVDAVEGHGTGTRLGDPIEAQALHRVYGPAHSAERPLWLGSVKSNLGHTQAAAGIAALIKMTAAVQAGVLPASLHIDAPNPHLDWPDEHLRLLTEAQPWPETGRPRRAGISSFGVSGTNAHLILEQAPADPAPAADPAAVPAGSGSVAGWVVSTRSAGVLGTAAAELAGWVRSRPELGVDVVAASLARRALHPHRAVVVGSDRAQLLAGLEAVAAGQERAGAFRTGPAGVAAGGSTAFLFTGQGSQYPGMGAGLYRAHPVFAAAVDEVSASFPHLQPSLSEVLLADPDSETAALVHRTDYTQPALFAVHTALARLLASHGVTPDRVAGHSVGEISAVHLAGVLDLPDAAALITARSQLMNTAPPGVMIAINAPADTVAAVLAGHEGTTSIAAINSAPPPSSPAIPNPPTPSPRNSPRPGTAPRPWRPPTPSTTPRTWTRCCPPTGTRSPR